MSKPKGAASGMTAIRRGVAILQELSQHPHGLSLADLARRCDIPMTTVHRIVQVFREAELVGETATGLIRIGVGSVILARGFLDGVTVREVARPEMLALVEKTQETCHLGVLASVDIVYLEKVDSPLPVRMVSRVGGTNPAITTAIGRAILAHLPWEATERVLEGSRHLFDLAPDPSEYRERLEEVRERGFAADLQENEPGICCVGAPVFDDTGRVIAALSISAPASRFGADDLEERGELVAAAARRTSEALGWRPAGDGPVE